jgi:hypothetical protein
MRSKFLFQLRTLGLLAAAVSEIRLSTSLARADGYTFAQYSQATGNNQWTISASGNTTKISAAGSVFFSFLEVPGAPAGPQFANFALSETSTTSGTTDGNAYSEAGFSGAFSFTDTALPAGEQNLLSGIFQFDLTGAQLNESIGGSGGGFGASDTSTDLQEVVMSSCFISSFAGQTEETATFSFSSLVPSNFTAGGPYSAAAVGTFSSNPGFVTPEPTTFSLIGCGALLLGLGSLRRKGVSGS